MIGLLVKDFRLMLKQQKFFLVVILCSAILVISGQDPMFVVNYITILFAYFTISTINYDEFNHGFSFLFTLPISRRGYVLEKYLYGLIVGGVVWMAATLLGAGYCNLTGTPVVLSEWLPEAAGGLIGLSMLLCVMLPVQLRYGAEKARLVLIAVAIVIFGGIALIGKNEKLLFMLQWLKKTDAATALRFGGIVVVLMAAISVFSSVRIVEKKQF